jgi:DNA-binding transcriptional LysR family regulator
VDIELSNRNLDLVHEGLDLAIRLGRLQDSRLVATRLAPRRMYLCAAPDYLQHYGRPHSLSELGRHNCLIGSSDTWSFQLNGREAAQRVQGNWRCNSGQAVLDAALRGLGLCQLPDYYVLEHLRSGALVSLLDNQQPPNTAVWALYPQQRHLSPKVRQLVDALKAGLAQRSEYSP